MSKKQSEVSTKETTRVFKGETEFVSDLFKLEVADVVKNRGWNIETPILEKDAHVHYFYSVDSQGRKQVTCSPIAGHSHMCEMVETNGELTLKVGPAIQLKGNVAHENVVVPAHKTRKHQNGGPEAIIDNHVHQARYIESMKVKPRKFVPEAQAAIAARAEQDSRVDF